MFDGEFEARLIALACTEAPEGHARWTVRLLADKAVELNFAPSLSHRLASRLEIHHTPKHGSWLNIAEIELSALKGQCLDRRIPDITRMQAEVRAWANSRNNHTKKSIGSSPRTMPG